MKLSTAAAAMLAAVLAENADREAAARRAPAVVPEPVNASWSDTGRCATWPCYGPTCNREFTRPSRSHDGRSCERCRRGKPASDVLRDRARDRALERRRARRPLSA